MGDSYLLPSIASVVIGGSSILGGRGSFAGTVGGAILLTTLGTVISALGMEEGWRTVMEGAIIVGALLLLLWGGSDRETEKQVGWLSHKQVDWRRPTKGCGNVLTGKRGATGRLYA